MVVIKRLKKMVFIVATIALSTAAQASSNVVPQYLPGGSIPTLSLSDVFSPIPTFKDASWWYVVGMAHDQNNQLHSLDAEIISLNLLGNALGLGEIGFSFKDSLGHDNYLWNVYPDAKMLPYFSLNHLIYANADSQNFNVSVSSNPGNAASLFLYKFSHNTTDLHNVGQIGAQYNFQAIGTGEVGVAANNPELVHYTLNFTIQDQRGLVGEGIDGYVGGIKANDKSTAGLNSWEFAMPNMRLLSWSMTITPAEKTTAQSPVQKTMTFQNNSTAADRLWLDRQVLYAPAPDTTTINDQNTLKKMADASKPLYHGTWMGFCFDQAPFKNTCGDAVAFWNDNTPTSLMDSDTNAHGGFINIFTPDSNGSGFPVAIGSAQTETLSFNEDHKDLPFQIKNDPNDIITSPISQHHYAKTVYVTIKKDTAFSGLFDAMSHQLNNDHNYVLKFVALSSLTENIPADNTGGFYEGAANVYLCTDSDTDHCNPVGTGFIEQMGY